MTVEEPSAAQLRVTGRLGGQHASRTAALAINSNDDVDGQILVTPRPVKTAPTLPPVNVTQSSFVIGETSGARVIGVWDVQTTTARLDQGAALALLPETSNTLPDNAKARGGTVVEVFVKDNVKGDISLVGTYRQQVKLGMQDFGDRLNTLSGQANLTFFAIAAPWAQYVKTCDAQGGKTDLGYCSFRDKVLPPRDSLSALGSGYPTLPTDAMSVLSYNLGNVAVTCGGAYRYKVCYQSTERTIADQILNQEYVNGKPIVVFLQEQWHGVCTNVPSSGNYWNPQLCDSPTRGVPSVARILGSRYSYTCTTVQNPTVDPRNGYECTGINTARTSWVSTNYLGNADGSGAHYFCADTDKWIDTGFQLTQVRQTSGRTFVLVNTHLAGTVDNACRSSQIEGLALQLRQKGKPDVLIAGDFNTEPYNDAYAGGIAFRKHFYTPQYPTQAIDPVASMVDSGTTPSARYVSGTPALDHVLVRNLNSGGCTYTGYYAGTDHAMVRCNLFYY